MTTDISPTPFQQMIVQLGVELDCPKCGFDHRFSRIGVPEIKYDPDFDTLAVICERCSGEYQRIVPMDRRD